MKVEPGSPTRVVHTAPASSMDNSGLSWRHPAELPYPIESEWSDENIMKFLTDNVLSIPVKSPPGPHFFAVTSAHGITHLPSRYRIPLLWTSKYQWESLKLVLNAADRVGEWSQYKLSILHVSRLCAALLEKAREAMSLEKGKGMDKKWRCPTFDRALLRYRNGCLLNDPESVEQYWNELGEEYYRADALIKFGKYINTSFFTISS